MNGDSVHRLGVTALLVATLVWVVRWADSARRGRRERQRAAGLVAAGSGSDGSAMRVGRTAVRGSARRSPVTDLAQAVRPWAPLAGAVCGAWVLVGGTVGLLVGLGVAAGLWRWRREHDARKPAETVDPVAATRQLPLAAELLAACVVAGAEPVVAAQAVGDALRGPVGDALARGAAEVRLGGEPAGAWRRLTALPGAGPLARLLERASESGLPAAAPAARIASDARAESARAATTRARRAAVLISAPVGLCFLPAFIAIGVLPVVIGLAGGVLGGGGR
ncbi:type II secretion system F family protein [Streptomyces sp. NPDC059597]|uniref:type II secretion system F family protein n=1 Tax=Streptomyces sp. NPDC059597 TaxID=3346879 RepID=UPI0036A19A05